MSLGPNLAQNILRKRAMPSPRGDNKEILKNSMTKFKNLLLQNHWANFNQTWHKASLGKGPGIQVCSNEGACSFPSIG